VAAASHRDADAVIACDLQCELNITRIGATRNGTRSAIDRPVPDPAQLVEAVGAGVKHTAAQLRLQVLREGLRARHGTPVALSGRRSVVPRAAADHPPVVTPSRAPGRAGRLPASGSIHRDTRSAHRAADVLKQGGPIGRILIDREGSLIGVLRVVAQRH
jgi:hypothetical protein